MASSRNRPATRARVIAAAVEVFAERGYAGSSIESIAQASGMTIGALYSNFSGKKELFLHALRASVGRQEGEVGAAVGADSDYSAGERLINDGIRYLRSVERDPAGFRLLLWSLLQAATDDEVREVVVEVLREQRADQESILRDLGRERGDLAVSAKDGAAALSAMAIGFEVQRMVDPRRVTHAEGIRLLRAYVEGLPTT
jgi:AcrR family transcriptional regulator